METRDMSRLFAHPESEWYEEMGDVLWTTARTPEDVEEPPYCGSPLSSDWPFYEDDVVYWVPLPVFFS